MHFDGHRPDDDDMSVFREVEIEWDGEARSFVPSLGLMRRIEGVLLEGGQSIYSVAQHVTKGNPPLSMMAPIIGNFLREAGFRVSDDDAFFMLTSADAEDAGRLMVLFNQCVVACLPTVDEPEGKPKAAPTKAKTAAA